MNKKNASQSVRTESGAEAIMDSLLGHYPCREQSSAYELMEFTLKSLRDLLLLADFKYVKSRKSLEMKTQEFIISLYLQANRYNAAGTSVEVMVHCKVTHNKRKAHTGLPESYYQHSELKWYELFGKEAFKDSLLSITEYIAQHDIPLIQQLISDPQSVIEENAKLQKWILSPYFVYRYGTEAQFEQARQRYVANLSEAQKKQYEEAVFKFQADGSSPIRLGEDWAYLTVAKAAGQK
ncbi:hypothetical protein Q5741_20415 [Paenibacillus sp. JX-17]|uniref:Uncharacterized protein n=1 Tax=Paenibacillus lacisoli TaxID=3064525 RepID=A0ABT9CHK2_9BACL|nr:hypothetical protein [Paenibacillus sp. JX-17]MDO7908752.1 hypothetical protein [Paenibacillus sp. JX-17]